MKRAKYADVTEWFSLDRYDYVLELSVKHVVSEMFMMSYHSDHLEFLKDEVFSIIPFPLIGDITLWDEDLPEGNLSFDDRGIMPLPFSMICAFVNSCLRDGRMTITDNGRIEARSDIENCDIYNQSMLYDTDDPRSEGKTGIFVDIGLDLMDDDEMIAGFKTLLKRWRVQTGIPESAVKEKKRFGASTIAKIHHYRIIPYLDISRWARINDIMVSNELYARLLFPEPLPDGTVKGGAHIRDTVKPFAESVRDLLSRVELKKYYADNPHIENMNFADFLKLIDFQ
ncbi:DUF6387 family protein [Enterobacter roggenkampii]|uniref:DUF6387 family protein n=1 Tax=Enterobacter roggenkampii TaxID=1812935 RepID=UPI0011B9E273|nr:DUF6387 family protein [Enterobacter roggenkampii]TWY21097.1 hypothetical protein FR969_10270 [Enterobacter roggenkampii]